MVFHPPPFLRFVSSWHGMRQHHVVVSSDQLFTYSGYSTLEYMSLTVGLPNVENNIGILIKQSERRVNSFFQWECLIVL
jgi:hypothetical protein